MTHEKAKSELMHIYMSFSEEKKKALDVAFKAMEQADKSKGKALEQEPCEDTISREALKHKLQEHHDFFVNAYGGFSNLPQNDKSRVDEILNCIAMVVNEPSVKPQESKTGHWIWQTEDIYQCSECGEDIHVKEVMNEPQYAWCPICGCPMEIER